MSEATATSATWPETVDEQAARAELEARNIAIARRALELVAQRRTPEVVAEAAQLYADDFHAYGPARARAFHRADAFDEVELAIKGMEATGSRVVSRIHLLGRHTGVFEGLSPTGRLMEAQGIVVHRIEAGRIAEAWAVLRWR